MSPRARSLPSLGLLVMLVFLAGAGGGWGGARAGAEARAFFGSLLDSFQGASLSNSTLLGGGGAGLLQLLQALAAAHGAGSFSDLFAGK